MDNGNGIVTTMPVTPTYGNGGGFGFDGNNGWWILLLLLFANGGWGMGGFGGFGGMMGLGMADGMMLYPWMNQANLTSEGFQNQLMNDNITSIRDGVHGLSTQICDGFGNVATQLCNGFAGVEQGANARQMANMQTAFANQTAMNQGFNSIASQLASCCCENRLGTADLKYTVATENCADRTQAMQNTRDIIDSQSRGTQAILDKLCQLELDNVKLQVDAKNDRIVELQNQLNMATLRESQTAQNAFIAQGFNQEIDGLYNRLSNCPVPSVPVYGRQPIFTCGSNNACGCGCGM